MHPYNSIELRLSIGLNGDPLGSQGLSLKRFEPSPIINCNLTSAWVQSCFMPTEAIIVLFVLSFPGYQVTEVFHLRLSYSHSCFWVCVCLSAMVRPHLASLLLSACPKVCYSSGRVQAFRSLRAFSTTAVGHKYTHPTIKPEEEKFIVKWVIWNLLKAATVSLLCIFDSNSSNDLLT